MTASMETFSLSDLAAGVEETVDLNRFRRVFKNDVSYPVEILSQGEVTISQGGYYVLKLGLGMVKPHGDTGNGDTIFLCLPVFPDATLASHNPEKIVELRESWTKRLLSLLRGIEPDKYSAYHSSTKNGSVWKFFDVDGHQMTGLEKKSREDLLGKAAIGFAHRLVSGEISLVGKRFYYVRSSDTKDPTKPGYDNFWAVAPDKFPLAEM